MNKTGTDFVKPRLGIARGFTLIELLVVIAIIALLASILIPVVGRALNNARSTASLTNLRSIGQLIQVYVTDNLGEFPTIRQGEGADIKQWPRLLWEHTHGSLGDNSADVQESMEKSEYRKVMWCPVQVRAHGMEQNPLGRSSYGMNNFFEDPQAGGILRYQGDPNIIGVKEPIVMGGTTLDDPDQQKFGTESQTDSTMYPYDTDWRNMAYVYGSDGTMGLGLYVDGHVNLIPRQQGIDINDSIADKTNLE